MRLATRFIVGIVGMSAAFFGTAGTFAWPEAWIYMIIQFSFSTALTFWLKRNNPELLEDRMIFMKSTAKSWDKAILWTMTILFIPLILLPGLDAVRYQWSSVPRLIQLMAFTGVAVAYTLIAWVMRENTYLSRFVEIQKERGHQVITTGPYHFVRHPMYVGIIIIIACLPLALGSLWTLTLSAPLVVIIVIRTHYEDEMLAEELDGYKEYSREVPYRLVPLIW